LSKELIAFSLSLISRELTKVFKFFVISFKSSSFVRVKDKKKDWLPYYFEEVNSREVEVCIESLKRQYKLTLEQFDFSRYYESDLFIYDLFKNEVKPPG